MLLPSLGCKRFPFSTLLAQALLSPVEGWISCLTVDMLFDDCEDCVASCFFEALLDSLSRAMGSVMCLSSSCEIV